MVATAQIRPYHKNPRKNDATVDRLVELIPKVGFNVPLVLDRDNVIVKGHTRWKAAIKLGIKKLPCLYSDADPQTLALDRLADNKVQEASRWDEELLKSELGSLNLGFAFDLAALDFKLEAAPFDPAPRPSAEPAGEPFISPADVAGTVPRDTAAYREVTCPECGNRMAVRRP